MNITKLKELWEKIKAFFKNMSLKVRIILGAVLTLVIVGIVALAIIFGNRKEYQTLFTGLSSEEASAIMDYLDENGFTDYRLQGDTISVRAGQQDILTSQLILAGYPKTGYLYETYFEKVGLTTTNSERNDIMKTALEQRLAAIIRNLNNVRDATVQITLGREQTYVLEDVQTKSSAEVQVALDPGYVLTNEEAEAIRRLVSHSVQDMSIDDVGVHDTVGNLYDGAEDVVNLNDDTQLKLSVQRYYEQQIRSSVVNLLTPIYGPNNVSASVTCTVDINRRVKEITEFTQPDGSYESGGLIGTETVLGIVSGDGVQTVGGIPGTTTNSDVDIPTYMEDLLQAANDGTLAEWYQNRDNKINESKEQIEYVGATITDIKVAVSVNARSPSGTSVDVDNLCSHVAIGAGIGGDDPESRVSVLIAPFYEEPTQVGTGDGLIITQDILPYLLIAGAGLLILLILLILILRGRRKRLKQKEEEELRAAMEAQMALDAEGELLPDEGSLIPSENAGPGETPDTGANIEDINTEKSLELRKALRQFIQSNPEVAAQMVKLWLRGGDDDE